MQQDATRRLAEAQGVVDTRLVSTVTDDAGEHATLLGRNVSRDYFQIEAGRYEGRFDCFGLPDITYARESQSHAILRCVTMPEDLCVLFLPRSDTDPIRVDVHTMAPDVIAYQPQASTFDVHSRAGSEVVYFTVSKTVFRQAAMVMDPALWSDRLERPMMLKLGQPGSIRRLIDSTIAAAPYWLETGMNHAWAHDVRQATLSAVLHEVGAAADLYGVSDRRAVGGWRALQLVRQARGFIEETLHRRITVLDVCMALNVSRRTLQDLFHRVLGMSPVTYLRMVRLHRARRDLRHPVSPSVSVGAVAARWGFLHASQFSVDYQRLFGERPSHTLRKAMREAGARSGRPLASALPAPRLRQ